MQNRNINHDVNKRNEWAVRGGLFGAGLGVLAGAAVYSNTREFGYAFGCPSKFLARSRAGILFFSCTAGFAVVGHLAHKASSNFEVKPKK